MKEGLGGLAGVDAYTADHGFEDWWARGAEGREGNHKLIQSHWSIWRIYLQKIVNFNIFDIFYMISIYLNYRYKKFLESFPRWVHIMGKSIHIFKTYLWQLLLYILQHFSPKSFTERCIVFENNMRKFMHTNRYNFVLVKYSNFKELIWGRPKFMIVSLCTYYIVKNANIF